MYYGCKWEGFLLISISPSSREQRTNLGKRKNGRCEEDITKVSVKGWAQRVTVVGDRPLLHIKNWGSGVQPWRGRLGMSYWL